MNAHQKQSLVHALADFYTLAQELGSQTQFPDASYFAKHPVLTETYRNTLRKARAAGCHDDSFIDALARDVTMELRRRKRQERRGGYVGLMHGAAVATHGAI